MEKGSPHVWLTCEQLTCTVITTIWWRGDLTCGQLMCTCYYMVEGSPHVWLMCGQINVHGNYYYMVEGTPHMWAINMHLLLYGGGEPSHMAHVWQLTCMVIATIWWRGPLTCGQLTCMAIASIWWREPSRVGN